jgi:hypothetical protein
MRQGPGRLALTDCGILNVLQNDSSMYVVLSFGISPVCVTVTSRLSRSRCYLYKRATIHKLTHMYPWGRFVENLYQTMWLSDQRSGGTPYTYSFGCIHVDRIMLGLRIDSSTKCKGEIHLRQL